MPPANPNHTPCHDRAQGLLSSHVTASEQFVTELRVAEFPNVTRKNTLKNSKYFKLQLFRDQPSVRILERTWIQMEGRTSLSHPSWAPSTHLLYSTYHPTVWSWFVTMAPSLSPQTLLTSVPTVLPSLLQMAGLSHLHPSLPLGPAPQPHPHP